MRANSVVALEHRESTDRAGDADGREAGMARGGERTAVIHARNDGHSRWHLVVQEASDFLSQDGSDAVVE